MKIENIFRLKYFLIFLAENHINIILENIIKILKSQKKTTKSKSIQTFNKNPKCFCFSRSN